MIKKILPLLLAIFMAMPQLYSASKTGTSLQEQKTKADQKVASTNKKLKAAQQ